MDATTGGFSVFGLGPVELFMVLAIAGLGMTVMTVRRVTRDDDPDHPIRQRVSRDPSAMLAGGLVILFAIVISAWSLGLFD